MKISETLEAIAKIESENATHVSQLLTLTTKVDIKARGVEAVHDAMKVADREYAEALDELINCQGRISSNLQTIRWYQEQQQRDGVESES